jgi:transposase
MSTVLSRKPYLSDVSDEEWEFGAPYLTLLPLDALQRKYDLREVFNAARWLAHIGAPWRYLPNDFPPWPVVYQQVRRWLEAGCFEALVQDLRLLVRVLQGRQTQPSAAVLDGRVLQSSPESGGRAGSNWHKRRKGSKVYAAVDTLGHLLVLVVTPANEDERTPVGALAAAMQEVTSQTVEVAFVDQGDTGDEPAAAAATHGCPRSWGCTPQEGGTAPSSLRQRKDYALSGSIRPSG